jgi:hypothetical protein
MVEAWNHINILHLSLIFDSWNHKIKKLVKSVSQLKQVEKHWLYDLQNCKLVWDSKLVLFNFHFVLLVQVESLCF